MQNLLLTIACAIILAVAAAFAAPFVVDWTQWRPVFEGQAARMIGAPVLIRGPIEARILPSPHIVMGDVSVGVDGGGTGLAAGELTARLSLGALMRGDIVADRLELVRPRLRLVMDSTGRLVLPTGAMRPGGLSISSLTVIDGAVELIDRANGRSTSIEAIEASGDAGSLQGPLKLDGEMDMGGERRRLRLVLSAFGPDASGKLRLGIQNIGVPFSLDLDGTLSLAGGRPGFKGQASLSRQAGAPPLRTGEGKLEEMGPLRGWSLAGAVDMNAQSIAASNLTLTLEASDRPVELTGTALFTGGTQGQGATRLELKLAARQLDLTALTGNASPLATLNALAATVKPLAGLATSGTLDLSGDTLLLSGAAMREVRAGLDWTDEEWNARRVEARLPGGARVELSGKLPSVETGGAAGEAIFGGTIVLSAEDLPAFAGWALPRETSLVASLPTGAARLAGELGIDGDRIALDRLDLLLGNVRFSGMAAYVLPVEDERGRLDTVLTAADLDLDPLLPAARQLAGLGMGGSDLALSLSGQNVRVAGLQARGLDILLKGGADGLGIEQLAVRDFAGLDLTGSGRLAALAADGGSGGDGRFDVRLAGARAEGLPALAGAFGLTRLEPLLTTLGSSLAPVDLRLAITLAGGLSTVEGNGRLGALSGAGNVGFGVERPLEGRGAFDIADGSAVFSRLGVPGLRDELGAARLEFSLGEKLDAELAFAGARLQAQGRAAFDDAGRLQPNLALTLEGADLARLLPEIAASGVRSVPASLRGTLGREGEVWRVGKLVGSIAGQSLQGEVSYQSGQPLTAELSTPDWDAAAALALFTGRSAVTGRTGRSHWPEGRFGTSALGALNADIRLNVARLSLPGGLYLDEASTRARLGPARLAIEEVAGAMAGGRLVGSFNLTRQGDEIGFDGRLSLMGADSAVLLRAVDVVRPGVSAKVALSLDLSGRGASPFALASHLQGQGSVTLENLDIAYNDPTALQYVMLATERGMPPDQNRLVQLFNEGLSRGPLHLGRVESAVSVVDGVARTSAARVTLGEQRLGLSGILDIPRLGFEATLEMSDVAGQGQAVQPAAAVQWRGPLGNPERRFDVTALASAINMRALDRETRRLEAEYGRVPLTDGGQATFPPASVPPATFPQATVPQSVIPQGAAASRAPIQAVPQQAAPQGATAAPQSYYGQYGAPGTLAPRLPPPVNIPPDPLRSPVMAPPLAP